MIEATGQAPLAVLCLNTGSSSLKAARYRVDDGELVLERRVLVEGIESERGRIVALDGIGRVVHDQPGFVVDHLDALRAVHDAIGSLPAADVVAHRIVHGGPEVTDHVCIDPAVRAALDRAIDLAPLHLPPALAVLDAVIADDPTCPQVACLDTAFHRTMPPEATRYALPYDLIAGGVRRYGFHGLSYEHVVSTVGAHALGRAVIAHLGNGCSLTAVVDGCSVDTTMGLTPMGGVVMGTRPGDLDPGVLLHLARTHAMPGWLEHVLDHRSGLEALSGGHTHDVRRLLGLRANGDSAASLALDIFTRSAAKAIGALVTTIGGLDTLVFTGGIGEHAAPVRAEVSARVAHLGAAVDLVRNDEPGTGAVEVISTPSSSVAVLVVPADEELVMAGHAGRLTRHRSP